MNKLTTQKRIQVVAAFAEGASINSVVRMTGVTKPTILKLLVDLGTAYADHQDENFRNLPCKRVQADEIWSFCFAKDKNLTQQEDRKSPARFGALFHVLQLGSNSFDSESNPSDASRGSFSCLEPRRNCGIIGLIDVDEKRN